MSDYLIKKPQLARQGAKNIQWAEFEMPVLRSLRVMLARKKPFYKMRIAVRFHVTKETANLVRTLQAGGAEVFLASPDPPTTQDDVAAALALHFKTSVFAWHGQTEQENKECLEELLSCKPQLVLDDGADLVLALHREQKNSTEVIGGVEASTNGANRIRAIKADEALKFPLIEISNAQIMQFDSRYGTGQSVIDGILRATSILLASKRFVITSYGWVGKGVAMRAKGMGCRVIVAEDDPVKALEALMDGHEVAPLYQAAKIGDIFVATPGMNNGILSKDFEVMKSRAIVANAGQMNVDFDVGELTRLTIRRELVRPNLEELTLRNGRNLYLIAQGRSVSLIAAEGNPAATADMSLGAQVLAAKHLVDNKGSLESSMYDLPEDINAEVARLWLQGMGVEIDAMGKDQKESVVSSLIGA